MIRDAKDINFRLCFPLFPAAQLLIIERRLGFCFDQFDFVESSEVFEDD